MSPARILIVDDEPAMREAIRRVLAPRYEVETAEGATDAKARVAASDFNLALVDVQLVDGNGYTVCRELKLARPETEVILMTGSISQPDQKLYRSLEEEAFYFLFKPFERRVLLALVERCLRLQSERRAKEKYAKELADDLERARWFQRSLLPAAPVQAAGWHLEGRFDPCDALGGDFYWIAENERDASLTFALCDVVGHGVSAAMYAGMLRSVIDAARRRSPDPDRALAEILSGVDFFEKERYATMFYGSLSADGTLRYFNAGHPAAYWLSASGQLRRLSSTGLFISRVFADRPREVRTAELGRGDRLLVYSDGIFEARDTADRELGQDGLEQGFVNCRGMPPAAALDELLDLLRRHRGERPLEDDASLLLIDRL